jgi:hypothetical protein
MTIKDSSIRVPVWLLSILLTAVLAVFGDMWRKVSKIESDLRCMRTALITSGVLDPKVVSTQNCGFSNDILDIQQINLIK